MTQIKLNIAWRFLILLLLVPCISAHADKMSTSDAMYAPNIAEIYIHNNQIKLVVEIDPKDRKAFDQRGGAGLAFIADGRQLQGKLISQSFALRKVRLSNVPYPAGIKPSKTVILRTFFIYFFS